MKEREPLTAEVKEKICRDCGGYCCNHFFYRIGKDDASVEFHKFKGRKMMKYGPIIAIEFPDPCPHYVGGDKPCDCYATRPEVCVRFPLAYEPLWNVRCKLQREMLKRGLISKAIRKFYDIKAVVYQKKPKNYFRALKF